MGNAPQAGNALEAAARPEPRRVLNCLVGGPSQPETTKFAAELAAEAGAWLVEIPVESLGLHGARPWARRSTLLEGLDALPRVASAGTSPGRPAVRTTSPRIATFGPDLLVVAAGVGEDGAPSPPKREAAAALARAHDYPVLRVRRRTAAMRGWLLLVAGAPDCGHLAAGLLRSGLWPSAAVSILPVADYRPRIRRMVEVQAELLHEHGRAVSIMRPIDLDFEASELVGRIGRFDAAVASGLSNRVCWPFGAARSCALETIAGTAPLLLVP